MPHFLRAETAAIAAIAIASTYRMRLLALTLLVAFTPAAHPQADPLAGVIDIHVHAAPDSTPRSIDEIDLARLAQSRGMRALVLKDHFAPTAADAYLVHKAVPGIDLFGGIDLNLSVGGINPAAVDVMARTTGHLGRFVWMGTTDTCAALKSQPARPCVAVSRDGALLPETKAVLALIAKDDLVLATGHNSAADCLLLLRAAHAQGIPRMVVTHAILAPTSMSIPQMKEAAALGAYIEFVYNGLTGAHPLFTAADYARAIRAVGPTHCILSSDMGQPTNPLHPDALVLFFAALRANGLTQIEIDQMSKTNPAHLLDFAPAPPAQP